MSGQLFSFITIFEVTFIAQSILLLEGKLHCALARLAHRLDSKTTRPRNILPYTPTLLLAPLESFRLTPFFCESCPSFYPMESLDVFRRMVICKDESLDAQV
jgi:hypothetical protein